MGYCHQAPKETNGIEEEKTGRNALHCVPKPAGMSALLLLLLRKATSKTGAKFNEKSSSDMGIRVWVWV
jgi:hypothetical protein